MFYLSGEIPRVTSYETGLQNHVRRNANGEWEADPLIMDERFLAVAVKGKGVVVFTACSHAGVVNVLTHARECFPDQKLYAVMGGFHLSGETERCIPETVRDIAGFGLTRDRTRSLHRLARAEPTGADLRRGHRGAARRRQDLRLLTQGDRHVNPAELPFDADAMLDGLRVWVECESPTYDAAAVNRMMDIASRDLVIAGARIERVAGRMGFGDCVRATLPACHAECAGHSGDGPSRYRASRSARWQDCRSAAMAAAPGVLASWT